MIHNTSKMGSKESGDYSMKRFKLSTVIFAILVGASTTVMIVSSNGGTYIFGTIALVSFLITFVIDYRTNRELSFLNVDESSLLLERYEESDLDDKLVEMMAEKNNIKNIVGKHFMYYQYLTDDNNNIDKECEVNSYDEEKECFYTSVGEISKDGFFHDLKCGAFRIMTKTEVWK